MPMEVFFVDGQATMLIWWIGQIQQKPHMPHMVDYIIKNIKENKVSAGI